MFITSAWEEAGRLLIQFQSCIVLTIGSMEIRKLATLPKENYTIGKCSIASSPLIVLIPHGISLSKTHPANFSFIWVKNTPDLNAEM